MPVDSQMQAVLDQLGKFGAPPIEKSSPEIARSLPTLKAVGGESAGANLATVACLKARDEGGNMPIAQLLIYPVTDSAMNTPSYQENATAKPLNAAMMPWFWHHYLENESQGREPYASPMQATDLSGLPAATVITAEFDPLRDEGEAYARRLLDAGVPVFAKRYDGVTHEFFGLAGAVPKAKQAVEDVANALKQAFALQGEVISAPSKVHN